MSCLVHILFYTIVLNLLSCMGWICPIYIFQLHMLSCMDWICPLYIPIAYVVLYVLDLSFIYMYSNCICCPVKLVSCRYCLVLHMLSSKSFLVYIYCCEMLSYCPTNLVLQMLPCICFYVVLYMFVLLMLIVCVVLYILYWIRCPVCVVLYVVLFIFSSI